MRIKSYLTKDNLLKVSLLAAIFIFVSSVVKGLLLFIALAAVTFAFNYYQNRYRLPFDISPMIFFSILIVLRLNIFYMAAFLLVSGILPTLVAGGEISLNTFIFFMHILALNMLISYANLSIFALSIIYPLASALAMYSVICLSNQGFFKKIAVPALTFVINIAYFSGLGFLFSI